MASYSGSPIGQSDRSYIAASMKAPLLEREYEKDLARRWLDDRDESALHEIIEAHARLVVKIAMGFRASGLPLGDLVQEGNVGLMEAADRFDPDRDVRFSTYATWWIVAGIQNYILRNSSIVRAATTPKHRRLFFNLRKLKAQMDTGYTGQLTSDDKEIIAEKLDVTIADIDRMEAHLSRPDSSLNVMVGEDESLEQLYLLPDDGPDPEDIATYRSGDSARKLWIKEALDKLNPRERRIISGRFLGEERETLAEIGEEFGVSKERVRQLESRALTKMKSALKHAVPVPQDLLAE